MKANSVLFSLALCASSIVAQSTDIEWQRTIGGSANDELRIIVQTNDGGYLAGGSSASGISATKSEDSNGNYDYWVVKFDAAPAR